MSLFVDELKNIGENKEIMKCDRDALLEKHKLELEEYDMVLDFYKYLQPKLRVQSNKYIIDYTDHALKTETNPLLLFLPRQAVDDIGHGDEVQKVVLEDGNHLGGVAGANVGVVGVGDELPWDVAVAHPPAHAAFQRLEAAVGQAVFPQTPRHVEEVEVGYFESAGDAAGRGTRAHVGLVEAFAVERYQQPAAGGELEE